MSLRFTKYEGLGNDILIFDFASRKLGLGPSALRRFLRLASHRRFGVGADQVLFARPLEGRDEVCSVVFYNADGSRAEMCGNGMRCLAKHLYEKGRTRGRRSFGVQTESGTRTCRVFPLKDGSVRRVAVEMGSVEGSLQEIDLVLEGTRYEAVTASTGNPHVVLFDEDLGEEEKRRIGRALQHHERFPGGVNVGFAVSKGNNALDLVVWERGCGFTLACGSGACAAAAAAVRKGLCSRGKPVGIRLPGGVCTITVSGKEGRITMTGPARRVFEGSLSGEFLSSASQGPLPG